ncbi:hypothetical protein [Mycobacteroides abscessus]|uniref:hypothetical protein n=1 Tax=Mycobacteroides abscessus TaxID=36809 RepID=UPI0009D04233|nr:hypothetical protein [Mycobacteroides abscessus]SLH41997.1 Uncharacterised protein [Mycobacteroides abscessus subsp. massiliense]
MAMAHLASMWGFALAAASLVLPLIFLIAQGRTSIPVVLLSALLASFIVIATSTDLFVIADNAPRESRLGYLAHSVVDSPTLSLIAAAAIAAWLGTLIAAINRARATTESKPDDHS